MVHFASFASFQVVRLLACLFYQESQGESGDLLSWKLVLIDHACDKLRVVSSVSSGNVLRNRAMISHFVANPIGDHRPHGAQVRFPTENLSQDYLFSY
jgi:hypothetical protein